MKVLSDDENDDAIQLKVRKPFAIFDSDDEVDDDTSKPVSSSNQNADCNEEESDDYSNTNHYPASSKHQNADSDDYYATLDRSEAIQNGQQHSTNVRSGSSSENSESDDKNKITEKEKSIKRRKKKELQVNNKLAIRSETQRMERENQVHLPYHRPKQRSLKEFMSRKKNHIKAESLRSVSRDMIQVWKGIDADIKAAEDFFKSESEEDVMSEKENDDLTIEAPDLLSAQKIADVLPENTCGIITPLNALKEAFQNGSLNGSIEESIMPVTENEGLNKACDSVLLHDDVPLTERQNENDDIKESQNCSEKQISLEKTEKWLADIIKHDKMEARLKQIDPSILEKTPVLSRNDQCNLIDLDDEPQSFLSAGAKVLMEKMMLGRRKNPINRCSVLTTSQTVLDDEGNIKGVEVEHTEIIELEVTEKPGAKLQQLKENLKNKIEAKWEEDFKKRNNNVEFKKPDYESDVEDDERRDESDCEKEGEVDGETESEPEEEDVVIQDKPRKGCEFGDSEAEESAEEGDDEMDDDDNNEEDDEEQGESEDSSEKLQDNEDLDLSLPAFQPGGGMLRGGSVLTQSTQPLPIALARSPCSSPAVKSQNRKVDDYENLTPVLCNLPCSEEVLASSFVEAKNDVFDVGPNELVSQSDDPFQFVSGVFPTEPEKTELLTSTNMSLSFKPQRILVPSDLSDESQDIPAKDEKEEDAQSETVPLADTVPQESPSRMLNRPRKKRLVFSDDENDEDDKCDEVEEGTDNEVEEEKAEIDEEVDYDSEENEVVVVGKKERVGEYFEKEAELSESEWSGDEDEQGLDQLEEEAGDKDVFDQDQMASQLGRIHMRRLLDEDARDVRILKELLFEDGDLHSDGKGRDRNFRWKNMDGVNWNGALNDGEDADDIELDDTAVDREFLKMRQEKAELLKKLKEDGKLGLLEGMPGMLSATQLFSVGRESVTLVSSKAPEPKIPKVIGTKAHGSFLGKNQDFLSRLARTAAASGAGSDGLLGAQHSRNFVFAAKEKDTASQVSLTVESRKRRVLSCQESVKRLKPSGALEPTCSLLDQLR